jgi:hypothetical protein
MAKSKSPGKTLSKQASVRPRAVLLRGRPSLTDAASRPGSGRSPMLAIRLPPADMEKIDKMAAAEGVKRSEMVRILLIEGITAHKPSRRV